MFTETLRMYPIVSFLERKCCIDYELQAPDGNGTIILPAGTGVYISVLGTHFDPTYFPEPQKFDPERFTEDNKHSRPNYTYLPFGEGPRMCLGKDRYLIFPHKNFRFRLLRISYFTVLGYDLYVAIGLINVL
jgi:cytochrome P450